MFYLCCTSFAILQFCNFFALPPSTCYGKAIIACGPDFCETSSQGDGLEEHWVKGDVKPICWILSILHWKASLHSFHDSFSGSHYSWFYNKILHYVRFDWTLDALSSWASSFPRLPRVCLLQLLLPLSGLCQTCHGKLRSAAKADHKRTNRNKQESRTE